MSGKDAAVEALVESAAIASADCADWQGTPSILLAKALVLATRQNLERAAMPDMDPEDQLWALAQLEDVPKAAAGMVVNLHRPSPEPR